MDYSHYRAIKIEMRDKIAILTLNRPESLNAFDDTLHLELEDILEDAAKDDEINALIITGAGKAFSCGGDIRWMHRRLTDPTITQITMDDVRRLVHNILELDKPLIGAINGNAIGLGATVALFCDITIADEKALIGDPHVKMAMVAGDGDSVIWPFLVGINRAKEYLMTGNLISAKEAERIGLVNHVVPSEEVIPKALSLAEVLANGPSKAIRWTKMCLNKPLKDAVNEVLDASISLEYHSLETEDHREAVEAFLQKRAPKFTGR